MEEERLTIRIVKITGRHWVTVYKGKVDVTSEYKQVGLTFDKGGKVTAIKLA